MFPFYGYIYIIHHCLRSVLTYGWNFVDDICTRLWFTNRVCVWLVGLHLSLLFLSNLCFWCVCTNTNCSQRIDTLLQHKAKLKNFYWAKLEFDAYILVSWIPADEVAWNYFFILCSKHQICVEFTKLNIPTLWQIPKSYLMLLILLLYCWHTCTTACHRWYMINYNTMELNGCMWCALIWL